MVLHKFGRAGELSPILYRHAAILLPRDDVVELLRLKKMIEAHYDTRNIYFFKFTGDSREGLPGDIERGRTLL